MDAVPESARRYFTTVWDDGPIEHWTHEYHQNTVAIILFLLLIYVFIDGMIIPAIERLLLKISFCTTTDLWMHKPLDKEEGNKHHQIQQAWKRSMMSFPFGARLFWRMHLWEWVLRAAVVLVVSEMGVIVVLNGVVLGQWIMGLLISAGSWVSVRAQGMRAARRQKAAAQHRRKEIDSLRMAGTPPRHPTPPCANDLVKDSPYPWRIIQDSIAVQKVRQLAAFLASSAAKLPPKAPYENFESITSEPGSCLDSFEELRLRHYLADQEEGEDNTALDSFLAELDNAAGTSARAPFASAVNVEKSWLKYRHFDDSVFSNSTQSEESRDTFGRPTPARGQPEILQMSEVEQRKESADLLTGSLSEEES